jgi:hypothetical protein
VSFAPLSWPDARRGWIDGLTDGLVVCRERMSRAPFVLLGVIALAMFDFSLYSSKMLLDLFLTLPGSRRQEVNSFPPLMPRIGITDTVSCRLKQITSVYVRPFFPSPFLPPVLLPSQVATPKLSLI